MCTSNLCITDVARACITWYSHWLSLLTGNLQLTIIFTTDIWNTNASKVLSTCADSVNCAAVLGKIECIFKNGYSIKGITL